MEVLTTLSCTCEVNAALFGNSLCRCDQVKMRWLWWALIQYDWCPWQEDGHLDRGAEGRQPHEEGGRDWKDAVTKAKECQRLPEAGREKEVSPSRHLRGSTALPTSTLDSSLQNHGTMNVYCFKPLRLWYFATAVLENQSTQFSNCPLYLQVWIWVSYLSVQRHLKCR